LPHRMTYQRLQWLFPVALTLHNGEETLTMPRWAATQMGVLPCPPPPAFAIRGALFVLTAAAFLVTYLSARRGRPRMTSTITRVAIVAVRNCNRPKPL
jgi:hypothetical protein